MDYDLFTLLVTVTNTKHYSVYFILKGKIRQYFKSACVRVFTNFGTVN